MFGAIYRTRTHHATRPRMPKILHPKGRLRTAMDNAARVEIIKAIQEVSGNVPRAAEADPVEILMA